MAGARAVTAAVKLGCCGRHFSDGLYWQLRKSYDDSEDDSDDEEEEGCDEDGASENSEEDASTGSGDTDGGSAGAGGSDDDEEGGDVDSNEDEYGSDDDDDYDDDLYTSPGLLEATQVASHLGSLISLSHSLTLQDQGSWWEEAKAHHPLLLIQALVAALKVSILPWLQDCLASGHCHAAAIYSRQGKT
jgi:hypothetical protein